MTADYDQLLPAAAMMFFVATVVCHRVITGRRTSAAIDDYVYESGRSHESIRPGRAVGRRATTTNRFVRLTYD